MKISIGKVYNFPDAEEQFSGSLDLRYVKRHGNELFPELLAVTGKVFNRANVVSLRYQIKGVLPFLCDRCLMQSRMDIDKEFSHIVVKKLEDENLEDVYIVCPEEILNIDEIVASDLLLYIPTILLCREDCKGLCSECGANLNEGDCGCNKITVDPRMAKLLDLL
ncbi:MAG: DUF177 domain-containing protein [Oscillospiraceae bacterium]